MNIRRLISLLALLAVSTAQAQNAPSMEQVIRAPADYAGQVLTFPAATLSGSITTYDVAGIRKYYLVVNSRRGALEAGFFLAPPALADKLFIRMDRTADYRVNLTCKVERLVINEVPQWHGIVSRVDFLDGDGNVTDTVKIGK
jgi:hypothetical protein